MTGRALAWAVSVGLFAALYVGLPWAGLTADGLLAWPALSWPFRVAGIVPLLLGAIGIAWCFALFVRKGLGTPNPWAPPQRLVTEGPFAWTRNPITLSHALATFGLAFVVGSPTAVIAVLLIGIPVQLVVRREERTLERRFGDEYRRYRETVPRWIPRRRQTR